MGTIDFLKTCIKLVLKAISKHIFSEKASMEYEKKLERFEI